MFDNCKLDDDHLKFHHPVDLKMKGKPEKLEKITADFTHEFEYVNI